MKSSLKSGKTGALNGKTTSMFQGCFVWKRVPTLGKSGYLQFIQQILPKVIYILNADKNWNNEICIWIRYLLCWSHWKWKHVCVVAQRLGINEIFYKAIWWGNSRLYEEIQYDVKSQARLGKRCFIRERNAVLYESFVEEFIVWTVIFCDKFDNPSE